MIALSQERSSVPAAAWRALALALLAWALLPWSRSEWVFSWQQGGWPLVAGGLTVGALVAALWPTALWPTGQRRTRGYAVTALTAGALVALVASVALGAHNVSVGLAVMASCLAWATTLALHDAGRARDPLVTALVVMSAVLIGLFIVYPLTTLARTVTWTQLMTVLQDPRFLLIENTFTPRRESWLVALTALGGGVLGVWRIRRRAVGLVVGTALGTLLGVAVFGRGALSSTLLVAGIVAPLSTLFALGFALLEQRTRLRPLRPTLNAISLLPLITPPFVLAFALILMFGRNGYVSANILRMDSNFLFGPIGLVMAQVLAFTPVAFLVMRGTVAGLNASLEEAAQTLGADRWQVFRDVTWPLLRPGVANALLISFIESVSDFGNPLLLGGDRNYLATEVFIAFTGRYNPAEAAVYGMVLLALVLIVFWAQYRWLGRTSFVTTTGKPSGTAPAPLPRRLEFLLTGVFVVWTVLVLALYASVIIGSLVQLWGFNHTFTLKHYQDFATLGLPVLVNTFRIALIAAVPTAMLGLLIAYLVYRQRFVGRRALEFAALISFAMPGTVMGVGYVLAFNAAPWLLTGTTLLIVLALVFREVPVGIRAGVAGLAQIDPALEEASMTLGANTGRTLRRVVLPLLFSAFLGALLFAVIRAVTAVSQIIFLVGPGNMLATVLLLGWVEQGQLGRAAAMSTVMFFSLLLLVLIVIPLTRRVDVRARSRS